MLLKQNKLFEEETHIICTTAQNASDYDLAVQVLVLMRNYKSESNFPLIQFLPNNKKGTSLWDVFCVYCSPSVFLIVNKPLVWTQFHSSNFQVSWTLNSINSSEVLWQHLAAACAGIFNKCHFPFQSGIDLILLQILTCWKSRQTCINMIVGL